MECSKSVTRRRIWNCPRVCRVPRSVKNPVPRFTSIYRHASFTKEDNDHLSIKVTPTIPSGALFPHYFLSVRYNPNRLLFSYRLRGIERPSHEFKRS